MIAILQPYIPHYRNTFFTELNKKNPIDIFCYDIKELKRGGFLNAGINYKNLGRFKIGPFLFYNPYKLLNKKYSHLILMLDFKHVTTWFLLILKPLHRKKIILWGHGISTKRYLKEENNPNFLIALFIRMADYVWFYTEKEEAQWKKRNPKLKSVALSNTLFTKNEIQVINKSVEKNELKQKYKVIQPIILIFSARFNEYRRVDLLEKAIQCLDNKTYGFIVIGAGKGKPDFSVYKNVYDFGELYDIKIKNELFGIADIYFQPAWLGLSVVEAMAYGLPVFTLDRSDSIMQGVEFGYISSGYNGKIFKSVEDLMVFLNSLTKESIDLMSQNAYNFALEYLCMENMVDKAFSTINE